LGRAECRPCDPGTFQPYPGKSDCLNCDILGDFYQDLASAVLDLGEIMICGLDFPKYFLINSLITRSNF
jgi:hypothetical protein